MGGRNGNQASCTFCHNDKGGFLLGALQALHALAPLDDDEGVGEEAGNDDAQRLTSVDQCCDRLDAGNDNRGGGIRGHSDKACPKKDPSGAASPLLTGCFQEKEKNKNVKESKKEEEGKYKERLCLGIV